VESSVVTNKQRKRRHGTVSIQKKIQIIHLTNEQITRVKRKKQLIKRKAGVFYSRGVPIEEDSFSSKNVVDEW